MNDGAANPLENNIVKKRFYTAMQGLAQTVCRLLFGIEARGRENVPSKGPVVIAATHASFIDPILLSAACDRRIQYVMYKSFYYSWARPLFAMFACIPVDEKDFIGAVKASVSALNAGACLGVFPEGAVSFDGNLLPPKPGALFLAQRSGAAIVPAAIHGNHDAMPRGAIIPRRKKVGVTFLPPFTIPKKASREEVERRVEQMMDDLATTLGVQRHRTMPPEFNALKQ